METRIYLDMDGVLTNFVKQVSGVFDVEYNWLLEQLEDQYSIPEAMGINSNNFWKEIDREGIIFWSQMEPYSWSGFLYNNLKNLGEVYICTSPSLSPNSHAGKIKWLQDELGPWFRQYIITPNKHLLANEYSILIDDSEKNTSKFFSNGGYVVLFPQPWNNADKNIEDKATHVIETVQNIKENAIQD